MGIGSELRIGLAEFMIIAAVLVIIALFIDPERVMAKIRGTAATLLPFLRSRELPAVEVEVDDFLDLHARLTSLSLESGGAYNEPLAELYAIYLKQAAGAGAATTDTPKKKGSTT